MKKAAAVILLIMLSTPLQSRMEMKESIIVKRDYGPISYAEDLYECYRLPMYYTEDDLLQNIYYLQLALEAPFGWTHRAYCIIETKQQRQKYKDLMQMQFNYLITKNYIYAAGMYDKQHYYYYNEQFKEDIKKGYEYAKGYYEEALKYWKDARKLAVKTVKNPSYIELDRMVDKAYKIAKKDVDYGRTIARKLKEIEKKLALIEQS